jgi:hypothetical protein
MTRTPRGAVTMAAAGPMELTLTVLVDMFTLNVETNVSGLRTGMQG